MDERYQIPIKVVCESVTIRSECVPFTCDCSLLVGGCTDYREVAWLCVGRYDQQEGHD